MGDFIREESPRVIAWRGAQSANRLREQAWHVPTPDHYLPLLYVVGTRTASEAVAFPVEGVDGGSVSMLAVQVG